MADLGIFIAEKLIETVGSEIIKEVCDMLGYRSRIDELKQTVTTIHQVLLCADAKRDLNKLEQDYIMKLKDTVYDADDLFDEVLTLAELNNNQLTSVSKPRKFFKKLCKFFSSDNQLLHAKKMSDELKAIRKKLDNIANDHNRFGFSIDYKPIVRRREETCSYVEQTKIIGREDDKDAIIDMLLTDDEDLCCVTVLGLGGLGKTALAQLVYNDEKVKKAFSANLRYWVCVSDQDGTKFDVKAILCQILQVATGEKLDVNSKLELVQKMIQNQLRGQKYLIVLDDVWNEDPLKWQNLEQFLKVGQRGSRILVTTRSESTGTIVSKKNLYRLQGLSSDNAWLLFKSAAFDNAQEYENHDELVELGRKIVEKCYNIPLAIKVVGSLLSQCQHDKSKWEFMNERGLADINKGDNEVLSILKLSYHNLAPSLKNCFTYCALFPKDEKLDKEKLISLWIAQGYIIPWHCGQNIEDAAEEHFVILLRRCFFQDAVKDDCGNVKSVKIHDLMHDVAQEVGKEEIQGVPYVTNEFGDKVRHVRHVGDSFRKSLLLRSKKIRSLLCENLEDTLVIRQIDYYKCLRVLVLQDLGLVKLPKSIGNLIHLRYLDMSDNINLEALPDAITRLHNLQTLNVSWCWELKELPKDFWKLGKLRHLDLSHCSGLSCMPSGIEKLTSLKIVPVFVVGKKDSSEAQRDDELRPLKAFTEIRNNIEIMIGKYYRKVDMDDMGGGYLKGMKHLAKVEINFTDDLMWDNPDEYERATETLEPPQKVKVLKISRFGGAVIPRWGRAVDDWAMRLPNLAEIELRYCKKLQEIPVLSKLPYLKKLVLDELYNLEYVETSSKSQASELEIFFPSLVSLSIWGLGKLKGWWKGVDDDDHHHLNTTPLTFPRLSHLEIYGCSSLTSFPPCPSLERLELQENNQALQVKVKTVGKQVDNNAVNSQITANLRRLEIDKLSHLKSLPANCVTNLIINGRDEDGESACVSEDFERCSSSLQHLSCHGTNLRRLCGQSGLEHFTSLETLTITDVIPRFSDKDDEELFWKSIPRNLHTLSLEDLEEETSLPEEMHYLTSLLNLQLFECNKLEALPDWIDCLSSLQSLTIRQCLSIKSIPQSIQNLTSLQTLHIYDCPHLIQRCKQPNGEDYPKIRHIPHIVLGPC